mmetsp:Transcript_12133/g.28423  ORF Transcript_12133/g.28423 Transcript_12133/m.28423 type:complete len:376 (+) Transcript_12133:2083-3210(+)
MKLFRRSFAHISSASVCTWASVSASSLRDSWRNFKMPLRARTHLSSCSPGSASWICSFLGAMSLYRCQHRSPRRASYSTSDRPRRVASFWSSLMVFSRFTTSSRASASFCIWASLVCPVISSSRLCAALKSYSDASAAWSTGLGFGAKVTANFFPVLAAVLSFPWRSTMVSMKPMFQTGLSAIFTTSEPSLTCSLASAGSGLPSASRENPFTMRSWGTIFDFSMATPRGAKPSNSTSTSPSPLPARSFTKVLRISSAALAASASSSATRCACSSFRRSSINLKIPFLARPHLSVASGSGLAEEGWLALWRCQHRFPTSVSCVNFSARISFSCSSNMDLGSPPTNRTASASSTRTASPSASSPLASAAVLTSISIS